MSLFTLQSGIFSSERSPGLNISGGCRGYHSAYWRMHDAEAGQGLPAPAHRCHPPGQPDKRGERTPVQAATNAGRGLRYFEATPPFLKRLISLKSQARA